MEFTRLLSETKPLIMELYERAQGEHALYETNRLLDNADDKLFELGSKYDQKTTAFTTEQRKECKAALNEREHHAKIFYYPSFLKDELLIDEKGTSNIQCGGKNNVNGILATK